MHPLLQHQTEAKQGSMQWVKKGLEVVISRFIMCQRFDLDNLFNHFIYQFYSRIEALVQD